MGGGDSTPQRVYNPAVRPGQLTSLSEPQLPHLQTEPGDTRPACDPSHPDRPLSCPLPHRSSPPCHGGGSRPCWEPGWHQAAGRGAARRWEPLALRAGSVGSPPSRGGGPGELSLAATWIPAPLSIPPSCFGDETPAEQTALKEPLPALRPPPSRLEPPGGWWGQSPRAQCGPCPHQALDHPGGPALPPPPRPRGPLRPPPEAPGNPSAPHGRRSRRPCWRHPLPSGHLLQDGAAAHVPAALSPGRLGRLAGRSAGACLCTVGHV